MSNPNINEINKATRFSKDNQPANRGRKPSKLKRFIKDNNLSDIDISFMIRLVFEKNEAQLNELLQNDKIPMLMRLFVKAFLDDFVKGRLINFEQLMKRAYGEPIQKISFPQDDNEKDLTDEEIDLKIKEILNENEENKKEDKK